MADGNRFDMARVAAMLREQRPRPSARALDRIKRDVRAREGAGREPSPSELASLGQALREQRPRPSERTLDEIKRDVLAREGRPRPLRAPGELWRRVAAVALVVVLLGLATSTIAASVLDWASGASFGSNLLGYEEDAEGVQFFFGAIRL